MGDCGLMTVLWTYLAVVSGFACGIEVGAFVRCLDAGLPCHGVFTVRFARPWWLLIEFGVFAAACYGMAVA